MKKQLMSLNQFLRSKWLSYFFNFEIRDQFSYLQEAGVFSNASEAPVVNPNLSFVTLGVFTMYGLKWNDVLSLHSERPLTLTAMGNACTSSPYE